MAKLPPQESIKLNLSICISLISSFSPHMLGCVWVCVLDRYSKVRQTGVCHTDRKTIGLCFDLQSLPVVTDTGVPPRGGERKAVAWPAEPHLHPGLYTASLNIPDGGCHAPSDLHCFPVDAIVRFVFQVLWVSCGHLWSWQTDLSLVPSLLWLIGYKVVESCWITTDR